MADVENILNDDDFFGDIVHATKEGIEQHRKREYLRSLISKGKPYLLGSKWTQEKKRWTWPAMKLLTKRMLYTSRLSFSVYLW